MTTGRSRGGSAIRSVAAAVSAWLAVVALGSTLVWAVVSRAGDGLVSGAPLPITPTEPSRTSPQPSIGTPKSARPTASPTSSRSPTPVDPPEPTSEPTTSGGTQNPEPSPDNPPTSPDPTRSATWSGKGGSVTARCTGPKIRVTAFPASGFNVDELEYEGLSQAKVKFQRNGAQELESEVTALCRNGAPQFRAEVSNESGE